MNNRVDGRLESLDVLRGLDLFLLVCFQPIFIHVAIAQGEDSWAKRIFDVLFTHVEWEGFHLWDQIMPLFLFMAGVSIPYAMAKYQSEEGGKQSLIWRVFRRVVLLWIFGAIVQGNLLDWDIKALYLYTDTLQAIAAGYLFSVFLFFLLPVHGLFGMIFLLPLVYTTGMLWTGGYEPGNNLAEQIDREVLGRFVYGATVLEDGKVQFSGWYHYGWIYSTLNFTATMLCGVVVGMLLKFPLTNVKKIKLLVVWGCACLLIAYGLTSFEPVIKRIWTSSMMFLTSGISILLVLFFYYYIDVCKRGNWLKWLKIYGMNSILAYMLFYTLKTDSLREFWLHGLEPLLGVYYSVLFEMAHVAIVFLILWICYRQRILLKV